MLLLLAAFSCLVMLAGCERAGGAPENSAEDTEAETSAHAETAEVKLEPMGDSGVSGSATFEEIPEGVQVVLEVSGLPEAGRSYYAQIHEGACSELREGEDHEIKGEDGYEHEHSGVDIAVALVRLDRILAKGPGYTHGGHEGPAANKLPGNLDQPIEAISSADGSASVSTLLEGAEVEEITSGKPKYLDLHPSGSEDPSTLACGDLDEAN